jgi:hypothetical protein
VIERLVSNIAYAAAMAVVWLIDVVVKLAPAVIVLTIALLIALSILR